MKNSAYAALASANTNIEATSDSNGARQKQAINSAST